MCAIPLSFRFSLDFVYFPSILVLSRERQLGKENIYEKINHHHPRNYYGAIYRTEPERRSTALDRRKNATDSDRHTSGASKHRAEHEHAHKRNVRAHGAPSRARAEKDPQIGHRMRVSDQRSPLGRQLLSKTSKR